VIFTDSAAGTVSFLVSRCVKFAPRSHRCTQFHSVGTFDHSAKKGANSFHWDAQVGGTPLKAGTYRLQATPSAGGASGKAASAGFQVT
jgi:hypothetical protein